ncbi:MULTISPECIES: DUF1176 domain-containing protein [Symbiopectobacterium]|uniref:DUF1176 domain-containing protein n=1 Tax=Symbiopectobacterium TaxID=801 RepID=UPI001A29E1BE|nr:MULTISPECIES: DUF1176 domain-containing protein [Symbiopectobacterium]MBG6246913.1 DUF1176 domain-containing protein [Candidatus Symbiopectobacterium sp. PLON1]MBT9430069.1 DUF1176 domain-containing protein [Candidatus Symbiopectobacterium endolongispinus]
MNATVSSRLSLLAAGVLIALSCTIPRVQAENIPVYFSHKQWYLVCDNTLTCRAQGYSPDNELYSVAVLLTRFAGSSTPLENQVMLTDLLDNAEALPHRGTPHLLIDGHGLGALQWADEQSQRWRMNATQFSAFLRALRRGSQITFQDKWGTYPLSSAGSSAVLLKMDDVQGRVDTRSALFKKGVKDESGVKAPVIAPVIVKMRAEEAELRVMNAQELAFYKPYLMNSLAEHKDYDCTEERLDNPELPWQIARLNDRQSLVSASCWMAAYNWGEIFWVVDNEMKSPAQRVTESGTVYNNGEIDSLQRARGLGDCLVRERWIWNGDAFVHSYAGNTGRCHLIRNVGTWNVSDFVTTVVQP